MASQQRPTSTPDDMTTRSNAEESQERQRSPHMRERTSHMSQINAGAVRYPNVQALSRPIDMPAQVRRGLLAALAAAAIIGGIILYAYFDNVVNAPAHEKAALEENLSRDVPLELPSLISLVNLEDAAMMEALSAAGYTLYEKTPIGEAEGGGFEVIKLPQDVTLVDAGAMYLTGVSNLSGSEAARLLNGSWDFTSSRTDGGVDVRVRYADFKSGSIEKAIQSALEAEGLADCEITDSGVDDAGNTYATGQVSDGARSYTWRVSVVPLSDVYDNSDLPSDALYVGVRLSA